MVDSNISLLGAPSFGLENVPTLPVQGKSSLTQVSLICLVCHFSISKDKSVIVTRTYKMHLKYLNWINLFYGIVQGLDFQSEFLSHADEWLTLQVRKLQPRWSTRSSFWMSLPCPTPLNPRPSLQLSLTTRHSTTRCVSFDLRISKDNQVYICTIVYHILFTFIAVLLYPFSSCRLYRLAFVLKFLMMMMWQPISQLWKRGC
mgnify:CR=1 FL=1